MVRLLPILKGVAGLAGLAVYVELVGGADLWIRYHQAQIPELQTLQLLTPQFLLEVGISVLFVPLLAGAGAAALQYILCPENPRGTLPPRFGTVLVALVLFAIYMAQRAVADLPDGTRWLLTVLTLVSAWAVWILAKRTQGFVSLVLILFLYGALFGACFKFVRELVVEPRFDLAVVFRGQEHRPLAGLYIARTTDDVLVARLTPDASGREQEEWQTIAVQKKEVTTLVFGPHGRVADAVAQQRADELKKKLVKSRLDRPPRHQQQQASKDHRSKGTGGTKAP